MYLARLKYKDNPAFSLSGALPMPSLNEVSKDVSFLVSGSFTLAHKNVSRPMVERSQDEAPRMLPRWALNHPQSTGQLYGDKRAATKVPEAA